MQLAYNQHSISFKQSMSHSIHFLKRAWKSTKLGSIVHSHNTMIRSQMVCLDTNQIQLSDSHVFL